MSLSQQVVTQDRVVIAKICSCPGCTRRPDLDTAHSYAFTICNAMTNHRDRLIFIPQGSYTIDQLSTIEQALAYYGIDLLPLDQSLLH